ncbi:MAG: glycosyltransferase WbuB [Deltaproteobacteria bacterium]|nr:glycosyltransferase WbuB [Deltaproteobacteria bacterium]MBU48622.1 glycosyltransferase WbuB [Deltaproteobacteria bacterium]
MKILFFTHYFPPEGNAPATRTFENCRRWSAAGHDVTVITGVPNSPHGVIYKGYNNLPYQVEEIEGIKVIRVWTYVAPNKGFLRRVLNFTSYMASALIGSLGCTRPDVMIATSPQFFCGWAGVFSKLWHDVPLILEIRDLWPDSIKAVGAMNDTVLLKALYVLEDWMYHRADHIVTVGAGYKKELLKKGVPEDKLSVIPNGVDLDVFTPRPPATQLKQRWGITQPFVCSYVGTIGMACGLQVVLESAAQLREQGRDDIAFLLVGDGAQRVALQQQAKEKKLESVIFTGLIEKKYIPDVLSISDVSLVHLKKTDLFRTVLPSKIFEAAGMQRPIILGVEGESARLLEDAQAGLCIEPENAEELVDALLQLEAQPARRTQYGIQGRQYMQAHYNRDTLAHTYLRLLSEITGETKKKRTNQRSQRVETAP